MKFLDVLLKKKFLLKPRRKKKTVTDIGLVGLAYTFRFLVYIHGAVNYQLCIMLKLLSDNSSIFP